MNRPDAYAKAIAVMDAAIELEVNMAALSKALALCKANPDIRKWFLESLEVKD